MKDKILNWLLTGRVGASSQAMAARFAQINSKERSHPYDPSDLNRCLLFLEAVPEARAHMDQLKGLSPTWSLMVERWDEMEQMFLEEVGLNWHKARRAPKTYELMKEIQIASGART